MKFIENVPKEEIESFVSSHPNKSHFMQSYFFGEISKLKGYEYSFVGVEENNKLIATAMVLEKKKKGFSYLYIPRGFVMDYSDNALLSFMTKNIKNYAKRKKSFFVKIDPDIKLHNLDSEGNIIGGNNYDLVNNLKKLGYRHQGFTKNFETNQPRYTFRLNIEPSIEELISNFHATTRWIISKGYPDYIEIYKGKSDEDYKIFYQLMIETAEREGIHQFSLDYYKNFHKILNSENHSDLYILKVNIEKLKIYYLNKIEEIKKNIEEIENRPLKNIKKTNNLISDLQVQIEKINKDATELDSLKEEHYYLSSIITVKYNDKVWLIHGGNAHILRGLNANYFLHYKIIEDSKNEGYKTLDFFGTTGDIKGNVSGIHLFKKRFGGEYTEFIGEFDLIINPFIYYLYNKILPKLRRK